MQARIQVVHKHDPVLQLDANNLTWLTADETARYQSITSSQRKHQFLAGHYLARKMVSDIFANAIEDWDYLVDIGNQRRLKCRINGVPELHVSLSHSGDWIAVGISASPIGIDIETYGKQRDFIAIASHVFSKAETNILKSLAPEQLRSQFYLYWTLKESVAKQYGAGLKFEVSRAHTFTQAEEQADAAIVSWQCPEYVIAVASEPNLEIVSSGLSEPAEHLRWQNVPA